PKKTLYISDAGMTGPLDGIIGQDKNIIINNFLNNHKLKHKIAQGKRQLNGVVLTLGKKQKIMKIKYHE
ncbi:YmdB family metallophosphoesterase, partial [Candidatus Phytoplasma gossypii]